MDRILSKSKYCKGVQCPKILWLDEHRPELAEESNIDSILENGTAVGELARKYFGDYSLVHFNYDKEVMVRETSSLMRDGSECIAEASFMYAGLFCSVDLLRRDGTGYNLIEVKSSTSISDIYLEDISYQYYVLINSGVPINHVYIMYINNQYVRQGNLDLQSLFAMEDCTEEALARQAFVVDKINEIQGYMLLVDEPDRDIDEYCESPYTCPYYRYCRRHVPKQSIFDISGLRTDKKYKMYHNGIISYEDVITHNPKMSPKQREQIDVAYYHKPDLIDQEGIKEFLDTLTYPIYHLDFETYQTAIPEYDGMKPYEQIPFQYSLHIETEDGSLEHREYLAEPGTNPRRKLAEQLVNDIPDDVCVLAYNMGFEKRVIKALAESYDDLSAHLLKMRANIKDLMIPFQKHHYYTEAMKGSYSIKYVLPALFPDDPSLDYHNLDEIHHGGEASAAFVNMRNMTPGEIQKTRENLLKYCGLDTFAMVKVLEKLREVVKGDAKNV